MQDWKRKKKQEKRYDARTTDEKGMTMKHLPALLPRNGDIVGLAESLPQMPTFTHPMNGSNELDVEVTRIQAETFLRMAEVNLEKTRVQAYTALRLASINRDVEETRDLISSASAVMSRTLDLYRDGDMPDSLRCRTKVKLSGLFGKSCTITVEAQCRRNYYLRGPVR